VILTAGYILWTLQRVFLGRSETWKGLPDMDLREITIAVPLVILTIAMGVLPNALVLSWMSPSVNEMVHSVVTSHELNAAAYRTAQREVPHIPTPISPPAIAAAHVR
jgi:NADH-quinone oxidoreductase subunit M